MMSDDNDGQMIFGDLGSLNIPDTYLTGEEKRRKNLTQETCPDRGWNPGPLRDRRACYLLAHSGGLTYCIEHRCGREVTSLLLTKRTRVRSLVESTSWLSFFWGFPSTLRQISGIQATFVPGYHKAIIYHPNHTHPSTDGNGL